MSRKTAIWLGAVCLVLLLCGCREKREVAQNKILNDREERLEENPEVLGSKKTSVIREDEKPKDNVKSEVKTKLDFGNEEKAKEIVQFPEVEENKEEIVEVVNHYGDEVYKPDISTDVVPKDTVNFVDSSKKEIMEEYYQDSVVDESDPSSFQIVEREEENTEQIPVEYSLNGIDVKYELIDGIWYVYDYRYGNITLDENNEELALLLLNLDGCYNGYDIIEKKYDILEEEGPARYDFHIKYCAKKPLEGEPEDMTDLIVTRTATRTQTYTIEEKVPVRQKMERGSGDYCYYGWQKLDNNLYYFDEEGEKVTGTQVIQGVRYKFNDSGEKLTGTGIKVSSLNGKINWKKVKKAGIDFAMIRCGIRGCAGGEWIPDNCLEQNVRGALEAGIRVGIYVFSQAVSEQEAAEEAAMALPFLKKYRIDFPLVVETGRANPEYSGRADGLSAADRSKYLDTFCKKVQQSGYTPMICTDNEWLANNLDLSILKNYPLWLIQYNSEVTYPGAYSVWEYTAKGKVDGIDGEVDMCIIYK